MSQARRYVDALNRATKNLEGTEKERPVFQEGLASVNNDGCLSIKDGALDPARACEFAKWIMDTFS